MIDGIGKSGAGRIDLQRAGVGQGAAAARPASEAPAGGRGQGVGGIVAELVSMGPPVDAEKVASLRQAIAEGRYTIDPEAIAERMIGSDLRA
jgi:negative regulator of flagellin synthesis FlgM